MQEEASSAYSAKDGMWSRVYRRQGRGPRAAIFLDRDGVIIEDVGHLHRIEDVQLMPGAVDLVRTANAQSVPIVVVTNQAGVGKGLYGWSAFEAVINAMRHLMGEEGATVDAVYACPFHPEGRSPYAHPSHPSRKPNPGMLLRAAADLNIDLAKSWVIGDAVSDVEAGRSAGLAGAVHLLTGHGSRDRAAVREVARGRFEIVVAEDLIEARTLMSTFPEAPPRSRMTE